METKMIGNDKQEWQIPILEVIASEKTEAGANPLSDGNGAFTES